MLQGLHNSGAALVASLLLMGAGGALIASLVLDITSMPQRRIVKRLSLVLLGCGDGTRRGNGYSGGGTRDEATAPHPGDDRLGRRPAALRLPLTIAVVVSVAAWLAADYIFMAGFFLSTVAAVGLAVTILIRLLQAAVSGVSWHSSIICRGHRFDCAGGASRHSDHRGDRRRRTRGERAGGVGIRSHRP